MHVLDVFMIKSLKLWTQLDQRISYNVAKKQKQNKIPCLIKITELYYLFIFKQIINYSYLRVKNSNFISLIFTNNFHSVWY